MYVCIDLKNCVLYFRAKKVDIRIGSANCDEGGKVYTSEKVFVHPKYIGKREDFGHDVGVIKIPDEMTLDGNTTKAITLVDAGVPVIPKTDLVASGWGRTKVGFIHTYTYIHTAHALSPKGYHLPKLPITVLLLSISGVRAINP
jgi:hypothetical protein